MKNIAIAAGGNSSEYDISIKSAGQIMQHIDTSKFTPFLVKIKNADWKASGKNMNDTDVDKNDFSINVNNTKIKFDCVLMMIHGTPGENGLLQGYFEMLQIPYTSSGVLTSAIAFDKHYCKLLLQKFDILSPQSVLVKKNQPADIDEIVRTLGLPCFVKPTSGGSSYGISKISKKEDLKLAIQKAFKEDSNVLIEEYIEGTEITCGMIKTREKEIVFPVTEIVSKNEFFDYEAKYTPGLADEITPARISKTLEMQSKKITQNIYQTLNCKGIVRADYIIKDDEIYFIELNTIPGMSENSIVPKEISAMNMSVKEVLTLMIEDTIA